MGLSAQARRAIAVLGGKEITTRDGFKAIIESASTETAPYVLKGKIGGFVHHWMDDGTFHYNSPGHPLSIDIKGWIEKMTAPKPEYTAEQIIDALKGKELIARDGRTRVRLRSIAAMTCNFPLVGDFLDNRNGPDRWTPEYWTLTGGYQTKGIHDYDIDIAGYMNEAKYGEAKPGLNLHDASTVTVPRRPEQIAALEVSIEALGELIVQDFKNDVGLDHIKKTLDHRAELQALLAQLKA